MNPSTIKYVQGDILHSTAEAVAHGVAPGDDFKQGLALSLRENWPSMYKDFRHFCKTKSPKEGELWSWKAAGSPLLFNLFTQEHAEIKGAHPGRANTTYVNNSLKTLAKELKKEGVKSLAITKLATGVGGLDWSDVKPMIEQHLGDAGIPVYVYEEFHKDKKAQES